MIAVPLFILLLFPSVLFYIFSDNIFFIYLAVIAYVIWNYKYIKNYNFDNKDLLILFLIIVPYIYGFLIDLISQKNIYDSIATVLKCAINYLLLITFIGKFGFFKTFIYIKNTLIILSLLVIFNYFLIFSGYELNQYFFNTPNGRSFGFNGLSIALATDDGASIINRTSSIFEEPGIFCWILALCVIFTRKNDYLVRVIYFSAALLTLSPLILIPLTSLMSYPFFYLIFITALIFIYFSGIDNFDYLEGFFRLISLLGYDLSNTTADTRTHTFIGGIDVFLNNPLGNGLIGAYSNGDISTVSPTYLFAASGFIGLICYIYIILILYY